MSYFLLEKRGIVVDSQAINKNKLYHMDEHQIIINNMLASDTSWVRRECFTIPRE